MAAATGVPIASGAWREAALNRAAYLPGRIPQVARERRLARHLVRAVGCPRCGAEPGEPCTENGAPRERNHAARVGVARARRAATDG